jgi:hypothetical protein
MKEKGSLRIAVGTSLMSKSFAEEIVPVPARTLRSLSNIVADEKINLHEFDRGVEVEMLGHVVGRGVVVEADIIVGKLLSVHFGILGMEPFTERDCGNTSTNKGILVVADKPELFRLWIGDQSQTE